jgi:uncharacterized repeat protein (TIGR01451 family)
VALLAGLISAQPVVAGEFFLEAEGTPEVAVFINPDKRVAAPNEIIDFRLVVRNLGTAIAPGTRLRTTELYQIEYVPGSTTVDGRPFPDAPGGNPFLAGVPIGDVDPAVDVVVTFQMKALAYGQPQCPIELGILVEDDFSGPKHVPMFFVPIIRGHPNVEIEKQGDMTVAAPGDVITYRLVVRNTGNGNALEVRVQDAIPRHTRYVPGSTQVNGQPVPDHLGGSPLEAGLSLDSLPAYGGSAIVSMQVRVVDGVPYGATVSNTARLTHDGGPDRPSNTVNTPLLDQPRLPESDQPHVPNTITQTPGPGRTIVTGTPTDITVCPTDCYPTTAHLHIATDGARGLAGTWLQVVGLSGTGAATIQPSLGPTLPERLSREGLVAPGVDTIYFGTFPEAGDPVAIVLSLTPKALQLVVLDQFVKRVAAQAGISPPTPLQVLAMYQRAPSLPAIETALGVFGPVPAPPPVPVASDAPFMLRPADPSQLDQLAFDLQFATEGLLELLYDPSGMNAFREALTAVLKQPIANAHIRSALLQFHPDNAELQQLVDELSLVAYTRTNPAAVSFTAYRRP